MGGYQLSAVSCQLSAIRSLGGRRMEAMSHLA